jgi:hypothetical protein
VTQVSQRTCIRETIIAAMERDEFSACGGDFYARGHIRAIAQVTGADPAPLIAEYEATHQAADPVTAADLFRPVTPIRLHRRLRLAWAPVLGLALVIVLGLGAYYVLSGSRQAPGGASPAARPGPAVHRHAGRGTPSPAPRVAAVPQPYARKVVIRLVAIQDCWVGFTTPRGRYLFQSVVVGGTWKRWIFRHAVDMRLGNPGGIKLTVDGKNPLPPGTAHPLTLRLGLHGKISS